MDIIIKNYLIVQNLQKGSESACEELPVKNKIKRNLLNRNPQLAGRDYCVFSFAKETTPELSNFLIPCIGVAGSSLLLMFYDTEHNIFLEIPFFLFYLQCVTESNCGHMAKYQLQISLHWLDK